MTEFIIIVFAILVAQIVTAAIAVWLMFNKHAMKWYARRAFKMVKTIEEEIENVCGEEE